MRFCSVRLQLERRTSSVEVDASLPSLEGRLPRLAFGEERPELAARQLLPFEDVGHGEAAAVAPVRASPGSLAGDDPGLPAKRARQLLQVILRGRSLLRGRLLSLAEGEANLALHQRERGGEPL